MKGDDGRPYVPGENRAPAWARPLLGAASLAFGAATRARGAAYDAGLLPAHRAEVPVVSVGNLAVGGQGKTPFTAWLAAHLEAQGWRPAVVSRGYGRRAGTPPIVVSEGEGPQCGPETGGDEPVLLATRTRAIVVVDPDRVRGAARAVALGADVVLLDDGFQHRRLGRDLDLVVLDPRRPPEGAGLLPAGPLREPAAALGRADFVIWNAGAAPLEVPPPATAAPSAIVRVVPDGVGPLAGPFSDAATLAGARVALLSGIARPARFAASVAGLGAEIVHHEAVGDHAWMDPEQVQAFLRAAAKAGAQRCLTTEKDAVRLGAAAAGLDVLRIRMQLDRGEAALLAALERALGAKGPSAD